MLTLRWHAGIVRQDHDAYDLDGLHTLLDKVAASSAIPLLVTITAGRADRPQLECVVGHVDRAALTFIDHQSRWYASEPDLPPLLHALIVQAEDGQQEVAPQQTQVRPEAARRAIVEFFTRPVRPQRLTWARARGELTVR